MGLFSESLERHEAERHRAILSRFRPRLPRARDRYDGYLPIEQAAGVMGLDVDETVLMARQGLLEWEQFGSEVRIRPAIVERLGIDAH